MDIVYALGNSGIPLYNIENNKVYRKNHQLFNKAKFFDDLEAHSTNAGSGFDDKLKNSGKVFKEEVPEQLKFWKDFTGYKNADLLTKGSKAAGALGTVLMVGNNISDAHVDGKFSLKKFAADTVVDFGASVTTTSGGAAIGSMIAPGIGTIIGAGVGAGINILLYEEISLLGDRSVIDISKDVANDIADEIVEGGKWVGEKIGGFVDGMAKDSDLIFGKEIPCSGCPRIVQGMPVRVWECPTPVENIGIFDRCFCFIERLIFC